MNLSHLNRYIREFEKRRSALTWRPLAVILSVLTALGWFRNFIASSGELAIPALVFLVLALIIFMSIPVPSIRSLIFRAVAFGLDLLILFLATAAVVIALTLGGVYRENAIMLAIVTWAWFAYFVFCDYFFGGTLGKLTLRLRLISLRKERPNWVTCCARTLLTIPVPLVAASYASQSVDILHSRLNFLLAMFVRAAVVCLIPVSMLFWGRDQSLVDTVLGTAVRRGGNSGDAAPARGIIAATLLSVAVVLALGCVKAGVAYVGTPVLFGQNLRDPSGTGVTLYRRTNLPEITKAISTGLRDPASLVADVEIYQSTAHPDPIAEESDLLTPRDLEADYAKRTEVPLIQVILFFPTSSLVKAVVLRNTESALLSSLQSNPEPAFVIVQLTSFIHVGPLRLQRNERFLFCSVLSGETRTSYYADLRHPGSLDLKWSVDFFRCVFLFDRKCIDAWRPYI